MDLQETAKKADNLHVEAVAAVQDVQLAHLADQEEHNLDTVQSFLRYPWASVWAVYGLWGIILISFDHQASSAVVGIPQFRKDFGYYYEGEYVLSASWQSAFNGGPAAM